MSPYDPAAHAEDVVAVQVSAFALLAMLGAAAARSGRHGRGGSSSAGDVPQEGEVVFTEVESAEEGLAGQLHTGPHQRWGDRSWTWRWAGTQAVDRASRRVPARVAPRSPLLARSFRVTVALAMLGVFDALAGLIGVLVFAGGVVIMGGLSSADAVRTLLGLATLWFAAPLIAGTIRPLRRPATMTPREHWDRTTDIVIASLVGAWAVQKSFRACQACPGWTCRSPSEPTPPRCWFSARWWHGWRWRRWPLTRIRCGSLRCSRPASRTLHEPSVWWRTS